MAVGAYVVGSAMETFQPGHGATMLVFPALLVLGGVLAAAAGLAIGIPTLRLRGDYLAIATLGFGEIIYVIINATDLYNSTPFAFMAS